LVYYSGLNNDILIGKCCTQIAILRNINTKYTWSRIQKMRSCRGKNYYFLEIVMNNIVSNNSLNAIWPRNKKIL